MHNPIIFCGSGLVRDDITALFLTLRSLCDRARPHA